MLAFCFSLRCFKSSDFPYLSFNLLNKIIFTLFFYNDSCPLRNQSKLLQNKNYSVVYKVEIFSIYVFHVFNYHQVFNLFQSSKITTLLPIQTLPPKTEAFLFPFLSYFLD